jgi:hypothetical protein
MGEGIFTSGIGEGIFIGGGGFIPKTFEDVTYSIKLS